MSALELFDPVNTEVKFYNEQIDRLELAYDFISDKANLNAINNICDNQNMIFERSLDRAKKKVLSNCWKQLITKFDLKMCLSVETLKKFEKDLNNPPPFTNENVLATLVDVMSNSGHEFAKRVDEMFSHLSKEHVTNQPEGFSKTIIYNLSGWGYMADERMANFIDLCYRVAKVKPLYIGYAYESVRYIKSFSDGKWRWAVGNIFEFRKYQRGTVHIKMHPQLAFLLNEQLAKLHPSAIPSKFRRKPLKTSLSKSPELFAVHIHPLAMNELKQLTRSYGWIRGLSAKTLEVLEQIGLYPGDELNEEAHSLIKQVLDAGKVDDKVAYQFYPTPEGVTDVMLQMIDGNGHNALEPSAGTGNIAKAIHPICKSIDLVELSKIRCKALAKFGQVTNQDFLEYETPKRYSLIAMNPPFTGGQAKAHVNKACSFLAQAGQLLAVVPSGFKTEIYKSYGLTVSESEILHNMFRDASVSVKIIKLVRK